MKNNMIAVIAAIGGLLILFSPQTNPFKPQTPFERELKALMPAGSRDVMCQMSESIRAMANTLSINPQIRIDKNFEDDPGSLLRDCLELSYSDQIDFKRDYPQIQAKIAKFYDESITDGLTAQQAIEQLYILADALD